MHLFWFIALPSPFVSSQTGTIKR